jgi:hypothetical protein
MTLPLAPVAVAASAGGDLATVTWVPPSDEGSPIVSYVVTPYATGVAETPLTVPAANTLAVMDLTAGTSYQFTVAATNGVGTGLPSDLSNIVVPISPCASDLDCSGAAPYCDPAVQICVIPCTQNYGCDTCYASNEPCGCSSGGQCLADQCAAENNCTTDVLAPYCDTGTLNCVACLTDTDCPGAGQSSVDQYCISEVCTACTQNADCKAGRGGTVCEAGGVCGCDVDSNCSGVVTGNVCNASTHVCGM